MFPGLKSLNKVESLQKSALRFLYEDCFIVLQKAGKETMKVNRLRNLCIEIFKLINNINPTYMNEIFKLKKISRVVLSNYKLHLDVPTINQVSFVSKSPTSLKFGIRISFHIKSEDLEAFINIIKNWNSVSCKCKVCQYYQVLANYFK